MESELVTFIREISIGAYKPAEQRKRALELFAAHDARESSRSGSTDIARGNYGPDVPDRDAIAWIVIDDERRPHYASSFPEACHDHINEALMHEDDDAKTWHVIPVCRMPAAQPQPSGADDARDASRYRFLRDIADCDAGQPYVVIAKQTSWGMDWDQLLDGDELDKAVDACLSAAPHPLEK